MSQISFADAEYAGKRKKTRREIFLEEMELVVPWKALLKVIEPFYPVAGRGRRPYTPRRVSFMRNTVPTAYTTVQTVVTVASGHVAGIPPVTIPESPVTLDRNTHSTKLNAKSKAYRPKSGRLSGNPAQSRFARTCMRG